MEDNKEEIKKDVEVKEEDKKEIPPEKIEEITEDNKHPGGRPACWTDPKVLSKLIDNYFETEKQPTLAGLALALDISRSTLYNYAEKDEFLDIIKKARDKVEARYETLMIYGGVQPTGVIFALKNMGWADKTDIDHTSKHEKINVLSISYEDVVKAKENE